MSLLIQFAVLIVLLLSFAVAGAAGARTGSPHLGMLLGFVAFCAAMLFLRKREPAVFANNFGILNNTIVVADAFELFLEQLLPLRNLVLDVQDPKTGVREGRPGDTITVKDWRTTITAYQPGGDGYQQQDDINVSSGDRQLTLPNAPWAISFALTAAEFRLLESGATGGAEYAAFRDKLAQLMINGMGKKLIDLFFAVITAGNYATNFVSAAGTFSRSTEIDLDTKLFGRNVPADGAQVILTPTAYGEWAKDHLIIQNYTGSDVPKRVLMAGGQGSQVSNFTFWRTNRPMPTDAARGFAIARTGVIAAFRIPDEATYDNDPVSLNTIIAKDTGIPLLARLWKNAATGAIQIDIATLPVFGKAQVEAVERIAAA